MRPYAILLAWLLVPCAAPAVHAQSTRLAVGHNAAITYSPQRVREMLRAAAEEAVLREMAGDFAPLVMDRP